MIKNLEKSKIIKLKENIKLETTSITKKILVQNPSVTMIQFAISKGNEIPTHTTQGDALVQCIEGIGEITIDGNKYIIKEGESIVMPANIPHSVFAKENYKMLLTIIF